MKKLTVGFYDRNNVLQVARDLLGKVVATDLNGHFTSGRIVEVEAYAGFVDKASHAFKGKRTARNEHMYCGPATAYVYICYGLHQMLNVVTNKEGIPDAILIRAIEPLAGIDVMLKRTGKKQFDATLTKGPGNVGKALGVSKKFSGSDLLGNILFIYEDAGSNIDPASVGISKRIGVESAGADGLLPYRFYVRGNRFVSGSPVK